MNSRKSLLAITDEIDCVHITTHCRTADGWLLSCKLDKKPAGENRCRICRRRKSHERTPTNT